MKRRAETAVGSIVRREWADSLRRFMGSDEDGILTSEWSPFPRVVAALEAGAEVTFSGWEIRRWAPDVAAYTRYRLTVDNVLEELES